MVVDLAGIENQRELDILKDQLDWECRNKKCASCGSRVWVAWAQNTWKKRCLGCFPGEPTPQKQPNYIAERYGEMIQRHSPEAAEVMHAPTAIPSAPMTIEEFDQRMGLIKHVVEQMQDKVHFGVIPGTHDKSLWEPGAEYLRAAFNIAWSYEVIEQTEDYRGWTFRYTIRAFQLLAPGVEGPSWVASGSNRERKFWCHSECPRPCDQDHEPSMEREMHPHNVRDRVLKRAFVGLIRNVTGTTGYFKDVADSDQERPGSQVKRQCAEHNKTFIRREKGERVWYSHQQGDGYCNAPKNLAEQWERPEDPPGSGDEPGISDTEFSAEEGPDLTYEQVLDRAGANGLDQEAFEIKVLGKSLEGFKKVKGSSPEVADKKLSAYLEQQQEPPE